MKTNIEKCQQVSRLATTVLGRRYKMYDTGFNLGQESDALSMCNPTDEDTAKMVKSFQSWMILALWKVKRGMETEQRMF